MKFGQLIDMINSYQNLEKLLSSATKEKSTYDGYCGGFRPFLELHELTNELLKQLEELREKEV